MPALPKTSIRGKSRPAYTCALRIHVSGSTLSAAGAAVMNPPASSSDSSSPCTTGSSQPRSTVTQTHTCPWLPSRFPFASVKVSHSFHTSWPSLRYTAARFRSHVPIVNARPMLVRSLTWICTVHASSSPSATSTSSK